MIVIVRLAAAYLSNRFVKGSDQRLAFSSPARSVLRERSACRPSQDGGQDGGAPEEAVPEARACPRGLRTSVRCCCGGLPGGLLWHGVVSRRGAGVAWGADRCCCVCAGPCRAHRPDFEAGCRGLGVPLPARVGPALGGAAPPAPRAPACLPHSDSATAPAPPSFALQRKSGCSTTPSACCRATSHRPSSRMSSTSSTSSKSSVRAVLHTFELGPTRRRQPRQAA